MHITRVELTNIKSYVHAIVSLRGGVTAIRGHNGAGKSTLLEAIGWALFDYLPYKQAQFVREGENSGKVTITFISPQDDCEYHVTRRCGSRAEWFIVNPLTGDRIDSNADVLDFLRGHMGIEGSIKLEDLFRSALGAPQGTLTADFLETPTNRKAKFDKLLQVEDYRKAADNLRDTASHLKDQVAQQDVRIAALEHDAEQLDEWRRERDSARDVERETARDLSAIASEIEQVEALLNRLRQAQTELARREGAARVAETAHAAARQQLAQVTALRDESRAAAQTLEETRADHEAHQRAERERAHAQRRSRERDELLQQRALAAQAHERASADTRNATDHLDRIALAERRIIELQTPLERQIALEAARDNARRDVQLHRDTREALAKAEKQRATLAHAIEEREREATEIETARPLATALDERRRRVEELQALAATREQRERRRIAIGRERADVAARRQTASAEHERQRQNLRKLEELRPLAEGLAEREREQQAADQALREIEARLAELRRSRELSGAGNCPFLREPCKNIQQRGENNLGAYFDRLIATEEQALVPARGASAAAVKQVGAARRAAEFYGRLDEYRTHLEQLAAQLAGCDTDDQRLAGELEEIAQALTLAGDAASLDDAKRQLRLSQDADKLLATLPTVRKALDEHRARLRELTDELTTLHARQETLADAPTALQEAEAALAQLNDPRSELAGRRALADQRPEAEGRLAQAEAQRRAAEADLARIAESLAPYATLADEITALDAEIKRAAAGHTRYLQHERSAAQLADRERDLAAATAQEATKAEEARGAAAALAEAQRRFDAQALAEATTRANELRSRQGHLREKLRQIEALLVALDSQITKGEATLAELERARAERTELTEMRAMLEQFRDTIKEAGPLVTQRLLGQISTQANAIFGEIMGDRAGELAWVNDYEIVLRRDGVDRTFALLSGGEQMAAALATRLALLRRLTGLDLAFFDEPTQNMDSERRSALAEQIRRVRGFDQLIVISHDDTFEQGLDSVIHLEKRNGVTIVSDDDASFITAMPFSSGLDELVERFDERLDAEVSALLTE